MKKVRVRVCVCCVRVRVCVCVCSIVCMLLAIEKSLYFSVCVWESRADLVLRCQLACTAPISPRSLATHSICRQGSWWQLASSSSASSSSSSYARLHAWRSAHFLTTRRSRASTGETHHRGRNVAGRYFERLHLSLFRSKPREQSLLPRYSHRKVHLYVYVGAVCV